MQTQHLNLVDDDMESVPPPIPLRAQTPRRQVTMKQSFETQDLGDGMANFDPELLQAPSTRPSSRAMSHHTQESQIWSHKERDASSVSSVYIPTHLPALQAKGAGLDRDGLEPLTEEEYDPASFDLVVPAHAMGKQYTLETQSELLFSVKHLSVIFDDPVLLQRFTNYLSASRPSSVPLLTYYLDTLKAMKAINYANSLTGSLKTIDSHDFTTDPVAATVNEALWKRANDAFQAMANHDLPAYITHTYIQTVSITIKRRITDTLAPHLRDLSEGLAEVFCLTDPSRPDNPIVFASEEFHRTTQYGMDYVLGRNCRFLQGPKTNPFSVKRIREKLAAGQDHCETFLNYRRDGSPFMNLLMCSPLYDSRGVVRYHLGAQVDVSGLVKECAGLDSLQTLMADEEPEERYPGESEQKKKDQEKDEFCKLAEMFDLAELKTVRESGGAFHRTHQQEVKQTDTVPANWNRPRLVFRDDATINRVPSDPILHDTAMANMSGRLSGIYKHYLLVRPYPSLRILFASPSLRVPGMLQSSFLSRIGGSDRVRETLTQAFAGGNGLTAKIRWLSKAEVQTKGHKSADHQPSGDGGQAPPANPGRNRWIHCTPLLGSNGAVGVWMVVLIDDESDQAFMRGLRREAPPVQPAPTSPVTAMHPHIHTHTQARASTPGPMYAGDDDMMSLSSFAAAHRNQ
ncbi:hypothetical protein F53441_433 [Fusarium austroafricanum]|uniref:PAS domain-containing protein n=1 Tax=Fusarium austroafricanum TaxID=2364996 RepID=A0A8H4KXL5_9HYPO|nr:hypothetical protein F53441_433 [Fusarium austroafricanum]